MRLELDLLRSVTTAFPGVTSVRISDALDEVNALVEDLALAVRGAASITLIASILVLAGALAAGHRHRLYDAVILKTLGATRWRDPRAPSCWNMRCLAWLRRCSGLPPDHWRLLPCSNM
jgi:predicted lysophospholipase L1 biosynthesis ABC-type transport system permease subunit